MSNTFNYPFQRGTDSLPTNPDQRIQLRYNGYNQTKDTETLSQWQQRNSTLINQFINLQRQLCNLSGRDQYTGTAQYPEFTSQYKKNNSQEIVNITPILRVKKVSEEKKLEQLRDLDLSGYICFIFDYGGQMPSASSTTKIFDINVILNNAILTTIPLTIKPGINSDGSISGQLVGYHIVVLNFGSDGILHYSEKARNDLQPDQTKIKNRFVPGRDDQRLFRYPWLLWYTSQLFETVTTEQISEALSEKSEKFFNSFDDGKPFIEKLRQKPIPLSDYILSEQYFRDETDGFYQDGSYSLNIKTIENLQNSSLNLRGENTLELQFTNLGDNILSSPGAEKFRRTDDGKPYPAQLAYVTILFTYRAGSSGNPTPGRASNCITCWGQGDPCPPGHQFLVGLYHDNRMSANALFPYDKDTRARIIACSKMAGDLSPLNPFYVPIVRDGQEPDVGAEDRSLRGLCFIEFYSRNQSSFREVTVSEKFASDQGIGVNDKPQVFGFRFNRSVLTFAAPEQNWDIDTSPVIFKFDLTPSEMASSEPKADEYWWKRLDNNSYEDAIGDHHDYTD